ncbi:ribosome hibernation factor-recruiting GTPase MRF [Rhodococcus chondri]|uniref:GTP-binding protein n=1 Tax=Rhodococcus chondri TaxID=3065941 RepID=A0ABU7JQ60_9NOCA|nr:GTP-binding protein [Rhodococcus sp. CC-R104]MEE2031604.1 GTP-binding protein [Rhodococcus sp. CC-R104]
MDTRTPLIVVSGRHGPTSDTAHALLRPGTVVVHHDLDPVGEGVGRRTVTTVDDERLEVLELAHGCVSCTLREDLLPLLRRLHTYSTVDRIVLHLDPQLEPEALCWAVEHVVVAGVVGQIDGPAVRDVRIDGVVTCLDAATWLDDATGDVDLRPGSGDDRTVAQVVVGQVEFADALVVRPGTDGWQQARLHAVLARLAPGAPIAWAADAPIEDLLGRIPPTARRGEVSDAYSPLLRGRPPLDEDCGVQLIEFSARRPFHPQRLHDAVDVLLDGVVRARGRAWVATQPGNALLLESAGGGLRVAQAGPWLATMTPEQQDRVPATRRAMAALGWDDTYGDRDSSLVVLAHDADPQEILRALEEALLSDDEWASPDTWPDWDDPFGDYHHDPCEEVPAERTSTRNEGHA